MNDKELFENNCLPMNWTVDDTPPFIPERKELSVLLAELAEIENRIEDIKAKQWNLEKQVMFHQVGLAAE